jgi:hypothetical protein
MVLVTQGRNFTARNTWIFSSGYHRDLIADLSDPVE